MRGVSGSLILLVFLAMHQRPHQTHVLCAQPMLVVVQEQSPCLLTVVWCKLHLHLLSTVLLVVLFYLPSLLLVSYGKLTCGFLHAFVDLHTCADIGC